MVIDSYKFIHRQDFELQNYKSVAIEKEDNKLEDEWQLEWHIQCSAEHGEIEIDHEKSKIDDEDQCVREQTDLARITQRVLAVRIMV